MKNLTKTITYKGEPRINNKLGLRVDTGTIFKLHSNSIGEPFYLEVNPNKPTSLLSSIKLDKVKKLQKAGIIS